MLEQVEEELVASALEASASISDPVEGIRRAFGSFLRRASEPAVRQIVLIDAHGVLGWQKWREIEDRYGLGLLKEGLRRAAQQGRIGSEAIDLYAHMLLASLIEVAFLISRADDPVSEAKRGVTALNHLIDRLLSA